MGDASVQEISEEAKSDADRLVNTLVRSQAENAVSTEQIELVKKLLSILFSAKVCSGVGWL